MPVVMTDSIKLVPGQTEPSTQALPTIPTIQDMDTWDKEKVLRWIQQRKPNVLQYDDLDNFNKARIDGTAFLDSSYMIFHEDCHLSVGASLGLRHLADEVKEGKFIPWT